MCGGRRATRQKQGAVHSGGERVAPPHIGFGRKQGGEGRIHRGEGGALPHIGLHVGRCPTDMKTDLNPNIGLHVVRCGPDVVTDLFPQHVGLHVGRYPTDM